MKKTLCLLLALALTLLFFLLLLLTFLNPLLSFVFGSLANGCTNDGATS